MKFTNRGYDALKFVALVLLPGLSAAYFSLAQIWDLPNAEQVVGTATILDTLLGLLLTNSSTKYQDPAKVIDGHLVVGNDEGEQHIGVAWDEKFRGLGTKDLITLSVVHATPTRSSDDSAK